MGWTSPWTAGKTGWGPPNDSWFTVTVGESLTPAGDVLAHQAGGAINTGRDPGSRFAVHSDDRYVAVEAGVRLRATGIGPGFFGDDTQGLVGGTSTGTLPAGSVEARLTIYDSSFAVLQEDSGFNAGDNGPPDFGWSALATLSTDVVIPPGGGYVAVRVINGSAQTLTWPVGSSILLWWA